MPQSKWCAFCSKTVLFLSKLGCWRSCETRWYITVIICFYPPHAASLKHCLRWLLCCLGGIAPPSRQLDMLPLCSLSVVLFLPSLSPHHHRIPSLDRSWVELQPQWAGSPLPRTLSVTSNFEIHWTTCNMIQALDDNATVILTYPLFLLSDNHKAIKSDLNQSQTLLISQKCLT